jgi:hypothetical protein
MRSCVLVVVLVVLGALGCDGSADLTIVNNTPGYANGVIDADELYSYGLSSGTKKTYTVAVGEGWLDNTRVRISANIHETDSPSSRVIATDEEKIHMEEDHEYTYVIPYSGPSGTTGLELQSIRSKSSVLRP